MEEGPVGRGHYSRRPWPPPAPSACATSARDASSEPAAPRPRGAAPRPRQQPVVAPRGGVVRGVRVHLRRSVSGSAGALPDPGERAGAHPAHGGADARERPLPRPRRDHRLPGLRLLRPPGPGGAEGPHPEVPGRHAEGGAAQGPGPSGRVELARDDDLRGGLRQRPPLGRHLRGPGLRGRPRAGQGGHGATHQTRRHPPRASLGDPQPASATASASST